MLVVLGSKEEQRADAELSTLKLERIDLIPAHLPPAATSASGCDQAATDVESRFAPRTLNSILLSSIVGETCRDENNFLRGLRWGRKK